MERLWTPWRRAYVGGERASRDDVFLRLAAEPADQDATNLILLRGAWCFVVMNLFPYNTGHLMIVPYRKVAEPAELTVEEWRELAELVTRLTGALREVLRPDGFNIGMNVGTAAGAGIPDHLHLHIVPRWVGDTNFMPVLGATKVLPELLPETYARLRRALGFTDAESAPVAAGLPAEPVGASPAEPPAPPGEPVGPDDGDGTVAAATLAEATVAEAAVAEFPVEAATGETAAVGAEAGNEAVAEATIEANPAEELPPVAQAGAVVLLRGKVVLRLARDGSWVLPKGHIEPGETPEATAVREVAEEMALAGRLGPRLGELRFPYRGRERQVQYYLLQADQRLAAWNDHLDRDTFLFSPRDALARLTHPEARAILARALEHVSG